MHTLINQNTSEEWREISAAKGYSVSSLGRVINNVTGKIYSTGAKCSRYPCVSIVIEGKRTVETIHRLVATAFLPNPENKTDVNHINGVKNDNRLVNLEWATHKENGQHALKTLGRWAAQPKGEAHSQAKLNVERVREMRALWATGGQTYAGLGRQFGVAAITAQNVVLCKWWKHAI